MTHRAQGWAEVIVLYCLVATEHCQPVGAQCEGTGAQDIPARGFSSCTQGCIDASAVSGIDLGSATCKVHAFTSLDYLSSPLQ